MFLDNLCYTLAGVVGPVIVPALVYELSGSSLMTGGVVALNLVGWAVPQILVAPYVSRHRHTILWVSAWVGRTSYIWLALLLFALPPGPALLAAVWVAVGVYSICDGITSVVWYDLMADITENKGALIGVSQAIAGVINLLVADPILNSADFPLGYAYLLLYAGGVLVISTTGLAIIPNSPSVVCQAPRVNQRLGHLLFVQALVRSVNLVAPFYALHIGLAHVGQCAAAYSVGEVVAGFLAGLLGDRPEWIVRMGAAGAFLSSVFALATLHFPSLYLLPFFFWGASACFDDSVPAYLVEVAPGTERVRWIGKYNAFWALSAPYQ